MRRFCCAAFVVLAATLIAAPARAQLTRRLFASGFNAPVAFIQDPGDRTVQYVVEQGGLIRVIRAAVVQPTPFLDLSGVVRAGGEQGLLGLAFAPDYATSGRFYVNFTDRVDVGNTVVARFRRATAAPLTADPSSRFDLRWGGTGGAASIVQPFANHNGGDLEFGPDGYLYIGTGDGGSGDDPLNNAQNPASLLGKMLRIDVNVPDSDQRGYRIPLDNPFVGSTVVRPEIWAVGLRNPWRFSFDDRAHGGTGALVIGDVGQSSWEEVDYQPAGRGAVNYEWRLREGAHDHVTSLPAFSLPLTDPIDEYNHGFGISITGGMVYRGVTLGPANRGRYFFGDFGSGRIWSLGLTLDGNGDAHVVDVQEHTSELGSPVNISSFGVDADGEIYIVDYSGSIWAIDGPCHRFNASDVDGDGAADIGIWRPGSGQWFWETSSTAFNPSLGAGATLGAATDRPFTGDIDGDGRADPLVWHPASGTWSWLPSSAGYSQASLASKVWGISTDVPLVDDLDGDGRADLIVWRPSTGTWFWLLSSLGYDATRAGSVQWGIGALGDIPLTADLDGDGSADLVVWRPTDGTFYWLKSSLGYSRSAAGSRQWGIGSLGDVPLLGDLDGDGRADLVVWRPTDGTFYWLNSSLGYSPTAAGSRQWGVRALGDVPVLGDLDGDRRADLVVWRPGTGKWYWLTSSSGYSPSTAGERVWGGGGDVPMVR